MENFPALLPTFSPRQLTELALLGLCLLLAAGLAHWAHKESAGTSLNSRAAEIGLSGLRRMAFPLLAMLFLSLARLLTRYIFGGPDQLLPMAMTLLGAMVLLRMVMFALQHTFAKGFWLVTSMRIVATLVWVTVALHLLGILPEMIALLDDISLTVGKQRLSLWLLLQGMASVLLTLLLALWISGLIEERLNAAEELDANLRTVLTRFSKALLMLLAVLTALPMAGIDLTTLSVFGGALGVGLGFGMQKIASNYVSGFILLLDRSITIGSVIAVGQDRGQVTRMTTRYTVLKDANGVESIVPNEVLVSLIVKNESYSDNRVRVLLPVQVAYGTNLEKAIRVLDQCAQGIDGVLEDPPPKAFVSAFGDSGIHMELSIWLGNPAQGFLPIKSAVNLAIWQALQKANISIPFPQREIRLLQNGQTAP